MTSSYTANLGVEKPASGDQAGTWGTTANTNYDILDRAINGVGAISLSGTTHTLTTSDGSLSEFQYKVLVLGGSPSSTNTITISPNDQDKLYFVYNNSGQDAVFTQGSGGNITVNNGETKIIYADGAGSGAKVAEIATSLESDPAPKLGAALNTNGYNIAFGDSSGASDDRLTFGAGSDLSVYHDGSNSYITDVGTGNLKISGSQIDILGTSETMATFVDDGAVTLYYDNSAKISTTSAGVDVTGDVLSDTFTLDDGASDWKFSVVSNKLQISYGGTAKMELDTSGNLKVVGNVTAYGTI